MIALYIILSVILIIFILLHFSVVLTFDYSDKKFTLKAKYLFFTIYPLKEKKKNKKRQIRKNKRKKKKLEKKLTKEKAKYNKLKKKEQPQNAPVSDSANQPIHETKVKIDDEVNVPEKELRDKPDDKPQHKSENLSSDDIEEQKNKNKIFEKLDDLKDKWEEIKPYIPLGKKAVKKLIKAIRIFDLKIDIDVANEDAYECAMSYGKMNGAVYGALGVITSFLTVSIKNVNISAKYNSSDSEYECSGKIKTRPSTIIALAVFILIKYIYTKFKLEKRNNETEM